MNIVHLIDKDWSGMHEAFIGVEHMQLIKHRLRKIYDCNLFSQLLPRETKH